MPAPTNLDVARTGTPDGTNGIQIPTVLMQQNSAYEAPGGIALSDRIADSVSADRTAVVGNDSATTDMSTAGFAGSAGANLSAINNRGAMAAWCTFEASTTSVTIRMIYYDSANNPLFIGPILTFAAAPQRIAAAGHYMSEVQLIETYGASKVRPYVVTHSDATNDVSIFVHPL